MEFEFADLFRPSGTIDRKTYALVGVVGFALKHNLDRLIATLIFKQPWGLFNYWEPVRNVGRITNLNRLQAQFLGTLVAAALPFIWVGVVLTFKRLRSAKLPPALVCLFFLPFLNLFFFLWLCLAPEKDSSDDELGAKASTWQRFISKSAAGSALVSLVITVPLGLGIVWFGTHFLLNYGWGLFVALPFTIGFGAAWAYGIREPHGLGSSVGVAVLAVVLLGLAILAVAWEGAICLVMVIPLAVPLAVGGGVCGYLVQKRRWPQAGAPVFTCLLLAFVPGVQTIEHFVAPPPPTFVVRSSIDIQAPPGQVWKQVVAFSQIPPPTELLFRAGIAYPIRAEMIGSGPGAERHCVFSTGAFVEPIQVWDEPRLLKFSVTSNPPPLEEWTPYTHIEPPHLHGYLVSEGGQFLLTPLANGGTRLEGTTWYRHGLWPANYWRLWSDPVIHQIHLRVLRHIRDAAEARSK